MFDFLTQLQKDLMTAFSLTFSFGPFTIDITSHLEVFNIATVKINLIPFFVQINESATEIECFHPPVNHHGTNIESVQKLKLLIENDDFDNVDQMYFHIVETSSINKSDDNALYELHNFNSYNFDALCI